ncbi:hypothetical protein P7H21_21595 [Paenibacillus larvae]|nr:hypothetical protein [Paenibacillus larvae]MDT2306008.1 hypothetical protein [Paenibacillus larvae]
MEASTQAQADFFALPETAEAACIVNPGIVQNQSQFPCWISRHDLLKGKKRFSGVLFIFLPNDVSRFIVNRGQQFDPTMLARGWNDALLPAKEPGLLNRLVVPDSSTHPRTTVINLLVQ